MNVIRVPSFEDENKEKGGNVQARSYNVEADGVNEAAAEYGRGNKRAGEARPRALLLDDGAELEAGRVKVLRELTELDVVGGVENLAELAETGKYDVVFIEPWWRKGPAYGLTLAPTAKKIWPRAKVVIISSSDLRAYRQAVGEGVIDEIVFDNGYEEKLRADLKRALFGGDKE